MGDERKILTAHQRRNSSQMSAPNPSINVADSRAVRVNVGHGGEEAEEEQPSCPNINFDQHNEMSAMPTKCMMCGADGGETRMLLTKIPMFREVIIACFQCVDEECGHSNQSVDFAGAYQEQGCRMELSVTCADDLERQIVKSDSCSVIIPEMEFSVEPNPEHRHGMFSNVTGILNDARQGVEYMAWGWKQQIEQIDTLLEGNIPFTFIFDDPSGNSYISSNESGSTAQDPMIKKTYYTRTIEQDAMLGLMREENLDAG